MSGGGDEEERAASSSSAQILLVQWWASDLSTSLYFSSRELEDERQTFNVIPPSLPLSLAKVFSDLFPKVIFLH